MKIEILLFLTTNMAAVTSRANQQYLMARAPCTDTKTAPDRASVHA